MKPRLIIGSSNSISDLRFRTRFSVADDVIWGEINGHSTLILNALEVDRGRAGAQVDEVLALEELEQSWQQKAGVARRPSLAEVAVWWLKQAGRRSALVPSTMAVGHVRGLEAGGISVQVARNALFPEREFKEPWEIRSITAAQRTAEAGLDRALEVLRASRVAARGRRLKWMGQPLTSEVLRAEIECAILRAGGIPGDTIVAGGVQACDPHERGHGPLKADEGIILDIFPRDAESGYFADMTRTVVKGRASEALRRLYSTVHGAQQHAIRRIRPGVRGLEVHEEIKEIFRREGYLTEKVDGRWTGFFHGTGHSLGLDIHEAPRFAAARFQPGHLTTVEPGLYYPEIGGVRLEDLVVVNRTGVRNLTQASFQLEL